MPRTPAWRRGKAEEGFRNAAPLVGALADYRDRQHHYPDSLEQLVPTYLTKADLQLPYVYRRIGEDFELSFTYVGPGMNECRFRASRKTWACSGHF